VKKRGVKPHSPFLLGSQVEGKQHIDNQCWHPTCVWPIRSKGLCKNHATYAQALIRQGKATEQDLIARKLMKEAVKKK
jgi:hypothetical protein